MRFFPISILTFILVLLAAPALPAPSASEPRKAAENPASGTLDDFEDEAARKERSPGSKPPQQRDHETCDGCDVCVAEQEDFFLDACVEVGGRLILVGAYGGIGSWTRMQGAAEPEWSRSFPRRHAGESLIPIFALDVSRQSVLSDVSAIETRGELGYGPFAFLIRSTEYREKVPVDAMRILQTHLLYRMSFSEYVELDAGAGTLALRGDHSREGFSLTLPLRLQPWDALGLEVRPVWGWIRGNVISDHTVSLAARIPFLSVKVGYRWVSTGSESLDGPLLGAGFTF